VLVQDEDGRWKLNPRWQEWMHEDGKLRISSECYPFISQEVDVPCSDPATPCSHSATPPPLPCSDPATPPVAIPLHVAAQPDAAQDISPPVAIPLHPSRCPVAGSLHPLNPRIHMESRPAVIFQFSLLPQKRIFLNPRGIEMKSLNIYIRILLRVQDRSTGKHVFSRQRAWMHSRDPMGIRSAILIYIYRERTFRPHPENRHNCARTRRRPRAV
jgi:hypothetical protein